jgi:cytoskeleton protein RodZ
VAGALRTSPDVPVPPETMVPESPSSPAVDVAGEPETPTSTPDRMILRVTEAPSWIRVSRDEEVLLEGTHEPGFSHGFRIGDGLDIVLGNAGAVRLTAGGESLGDPGDIGEVYSGTVVVERDGAELIP